MARQRRARLRRRELRPRRPRARGEESGSKRSVCRQWAADRSSAPHGETLRLFPPRHSETFRRARGQEGPRGIGSGCEIHVRGHDTNCIKQRYKTSARLLPLESHARGCSGSKFFYAPGPAVQGRSSRAPSPARPSLDLQSDHVLLRALAFVGADKSSQSLSKPHPKPHREGYIGSNSRTLLRRIHVGGMCRRVFL